MRAGSVPSSISRSSRSVSTVVLPVPAEAETQTEARGSAARRCGVGGARSFLGLAASDPFEMRGNRKSAAAASRAGTAR